MLEAKAKDQGHKAQVLSKKKKKKKVFTKIFQAISKKKKKKKKKKGLHKIFQAISTKKRFPKNFSTAPQNFNFPKNSAVLEPRTGQFSRTSGLEAKAKAKDLTFEAKAKDFKICPRGRPRGQGRPRGLHLCHIQFKSPQEKKSHVCEPPKKKARIEGEEQAVPVQCPRVQSSTESPPFKPQPNSAESLNP